MALHNLQVGSLALVGPVHTNAVREFQYVEVISINGTSTTVKPVGPGIGEDSAGFEMATDLLKQRVVREEERENWPGSFLAHPVAFIATTEDGVEEWKYGVVTGYSVVGTASILRVTSSTGPDKVTLSDQDNVIKVDTLNYVLQTGAESNAMAVSAPELLDQQNRVIELCGSRRRVLPANVINMLTIPWDGTTLVPLVRPNDLRLVRVSRQHALECVMGPRSRRPENLYVDPSIQPRTQSSEVGATETSNSAYRRRASSVDAQTRGTSITQEHGSLSSSDEDADSDIRQVQHQNEPLSKRRRLDEEVSSRSSSASQRGTRTLAGRRSTIVSEHEVDIHRLVVHPRHAGKSAQSLLQCAQQSPHVSFLATPAVLRALYSFGFGAGLFVMHMRRTTASETLEASEKGVNMIDFTSKQAPPAPAKVTCHDDVVSALNSLYTFARYFFNESVVELIDTARSFVLSYRDYGEPELELTKFLAVWVTKKFRRFRSLLVSDGLEEAMNVLREFKRSDDELVAWRESRHAANSTHNSRYTQSQHGGHRGQRTSRSDRVPQDVINGLPVEGGKRLCLKYLSKMGCTYPACARGHFRPSSITAEARATIIRKWQGVAAEFQNL